MAVQGSGSAAELAASRKQAKYVNLQSQPTAVETLGPINESACAFLDDLGRRISLLTDKDRKRMFLFQRDSIAVQHFNAVLLHDGFVSLNYPHYFPLQLFSLY